MSSAKINIDTSKDELILLVNRLTSIIDRQERLIARQEQDITDLKWENTQLKSRLTKATKKIEKLEKQITELREDLRIAKLPTNSSNSSLPPSSDLYKPILKKNYSLRAKTGRKPGGQPDHRGATLKFSDDPPDEEIIHEVEVCGACGKDLSDIVGQKMQTHQVVDISIPKRIHINHVITVKQCSCGYCNRAEFPEGAKGPVNYGSRIRGLIANLAVRQYIPFKRTVEFMEDIFSIPMSEGTVANLLEQFTNRAEKEYKRIRDQVSQAPVVGADETGCKVNGKPHWFHTYQTQKFTFIGYHPSRGSKAQKVFYPKGLPNSILVSDCLPMQLSTPCAAHQLCHAHLARELNAFEEKYPNRSWPKAVKKLFHEALLLGKDPPDEKKIKQVVEKFNKLLEKDQSQAPGKIHSFWKRLNKHKDKVFTFLYYPDVPPDNNGSERAIRNVKVKQKVSGQFKTGTGAHRYAVIRSIIDTLIKQDKSVYEGLTQIASL